MLVITLKMVYQDGPITRHRILGAIAAYLMIAGLFGKVYAMINYLIPGAFDASHEFSRFSVEGTEDFLYFSVVALTTMGFGDITPVAPIARSFVMIEGLVGQLYPAVFIARLVSLSLAVKEGKVIQPPPRGKPDFERMRTWRIKEEVRIKREKGAGNQSSSRPDPEDLEETDG